MHYNAAIMSQSLGVFDIFKGLCAVGSAIVIGVLMFWGPQELRDELPDFWRQTLGVGSFAFGGLFGLTLIFASQSSKSSQAIASRLKGLLLAFICGVLLTIVVMTKGRDVFAAWRLQDQGKQTVATIESIGRKSTSRIAPTSTTSNTMTTARRFNCKAHSRKATP